MGQNPRNITLPSPLEGLELSLFKRKNISLFLKRDDLIHSEISGNKWRKLKYNLLEAKKKGFTKLLTFGGAFSNHLAATALAAKMNGFQLTCFVRGEEQLPLNSTLKKAKDYGTSYIYIDRESYRLRNEVQYLKQLQLEYPDHYIIPEGGTNELAVKGVSELIREIKQPYTHICTPVGSAGTISGLIAGLKGKNKILGFPAIKGGEYLNDVIKGLSPKNITNWKLINDYHFGGFGKVKANQIAFKDQFETTFGIQLDPIYTSKMLFGIFDLIEKDYFEPNSTIIAIHTGGLQGNLGMKNKMDVLRQQRPNLTNWF